MKYLLLLMLSFHLFCKDLNILEYNVQNFFDDVKNKNKYSDNSVSSKEFLKKANNIAKVISSIIIDYGLDIICLTEVENENALNELRKNIKNFSGQEYKYYYIQTSKFSTNPAIISKYPIIYVHKNKIQTKYFAMRDILEIKIKISANNELVILQNQWPVNIKNKFSNGKEKRILAATFLNFINRDILKENKNEQIVILGGFNVNISDNDAIILDKYRSDRLNISYKESLVIPNFGIWYSPKIENGNYYFRNWSLLDQFFLNKNLIDNHLLTYKDCFVYKKDFMLSKNIPYRFFKLKGYSDHLPLILRIKILTY